MERTTQISWMPLATHEALFDELEKIASALHEERRHRTKKWLKNTAIVSAAAGTSVALTAIGQRVFDKKLGPAWEKLDDKAKAFIVAPLLGLTFLGSRMLGKKVIEERKKVLDE